MNWRVVAVTGLLALLGGLAGALGGALIASVLLLVLRDLPSANVLRGLFGTAGAIGFGVGLVAGPILSWTLLRRAPIWRAIAEPALGAGLAAGLSLGIDIGYHDLGFWPMIGVSVLGATLAALRLRREVNRAPAPTA